MFFALQLMGSHEKVKLHILIPHICHYLTTYVPIDITYYTPCVQIRHITVCTLKLVPAEFGCHITKVNAAQWSIIKRI